jgi:hypothetical protein
LAIFRVLKYFLDFFWNYLCTEKYFGKKPLPTGLGRARGPNPTRSGPVVSPHGPSGRARGKARVQRRRCRAPFLVVRATLGCNSCPIKPRDPSPVHPVIAAPHPCLCAAVVPARDRAGHCRALATAAARFVGLWGARAVRCRDEIPPLLLVDPWSPECHHHCEDRLP